MTRAVQSTHEKGYTETMSDAQRVSIADMIGDPDPDCRADKPWPSDQDCLGCDRHVNGPHRFTCRATSGARVKLHVDGSQIKTYVSGSK